MTATLVMALCTASAARAETTTSTAARGQATKAAESKPDVKVAEEVKPAAKPAPFKGFSITSDDDRFKLSFRGIIQVDSRYFLGDSRIDRAKFPDTLFLKTLRPYLDGKAFNIVGFRMSPEFGNGTPQVVDGWVDLYAHPALNFRFGKATVNLGLERLQGQADIPFSERSQVSNLLPNRDVGAQVFGKIAGGGLEYSLGIWDGAPDAGSVDKDADDRKDYVGRLFVRPFKFLDNDAVDLGIGIAGSHGIRRGSATATQLPTYVSPAQEQVFFYNSSATDATKTVYANGSLDRFTPQMNFYYGPFGFFAEYAHTSQEVAQGSDQGKIIHDAWGATATFLVTGEKARYTLPDITSPASMSPFSPGAIEIVLRYDQAAYSKAAIGRFADSKKSYSDVKGFWGGINWYLNNVSHLSLYFVHSELTVGNATAGAALPTSENALVAQAQANF